MRLDRTWVIAKREYLTRIKGKGFWIGTLVIPTFLVGVMVVPSILLQRADTRQKLVVVDETGRVAPEFARVLAEKEREERQAKRQPPRPEARGGEPRAPRARFDLLIEPPESDRQTQEKALEKRVRDEQIDAWVWIGPRTLEDNKVEYRARSVSNFVTQDVLADDLSAAVRQVRLREAGLDPEQVRRLTDPVDLKTLRVVEEGSRAEGGFAGILFVWILFMMLYMTIALWGQQVMVGVLEEKGSRIVEVLTSSVKPMDLMMGKLLGICLLGLTQIVLWLGTTTLLTAPGVLAATAALPEGTTLPSFTPVMAIHYALLYALGFFVYASFYAAVGAAFNNLQEAQQVAGMLIFFLIVPMLLVWRVINDPGSTLAVVTSLVPLFAPLMMPLRIAIQMPPLWQILLCYVLLIAFIVGMVWVCARIYRVGILMYGKKPTVQEIWRWIRYA
jgi:ABC-2 type transport system permease protein